MITRTPNETAAHHAARAAIVAERIAQRRADIEDAVVRAAFLTGGPDEALAACRAIAATEEVTG